MEPTRYKILIVDDEENMRQLMVSLLTRKGHQCVTARDGIEALDKMMKAKFDALITDIVMPKMDGIALTKEVSNHLQNFPIMVITGHTEDYSAATAITSGAQEFINKPFSISEFIIRFDKMMREHEALSKMTQKHNEMLFNLQMNSSEEIEKLKSQIKAVGGRWSYFHDFND